MHALRQAAIQNPALKHAYYHTEKQRDVRSPKILYRVTSPLQTDVFTTQYTVRFETEQVSPLSLQLIMVVLATWTHCRVAHNAERCQEQGHSATKRQPEPGREGEYRLCPCVYAVHRDGPVEDHWDH